jgi:selenocysteine lyase/cysteine desulfurase
VSHPEFPLDPNLIYLNHAAVSPWPKRTVDAVKDFAEENALLGSKNYLNWMNKESKLRRQLQQLLNAPSSDDIALVKNTSEALSFVAYGLNWQAGDNIVSSNLEFPSNRIPWQSLINQGVEFREADFSHTDSPEQALFDLVDDHTRLITISSIQFATGLAVDLNRIGAFCKQHDILFCVDAIQSLGAVQFDVQACQADFVMADGHKWMLGPEGLGVFYTTPESRDKLRLTQYGWRMIENIHKYQNKPWKMHQSARRFECGSPNMLGIHALSASLSLILETGMTAIERLVMANTQYLIDSISESPHLVLLSKPRQQFKSGIVLFQHASIDDRLVFKHLSDSGVICAQRGAGIRFSPHFYNTQAELDQAIKTAKTS